MLSDYWLLTDLDGTLIATPHKAHGRYLPITQSPCFEPVKQWLSNGGNVCIVTTADLRVIDQIYHPLRPFLKTHGEYVKDAAVNATSAPAVAGPAAAADGSAKAPTTPPPPRRGCLLLSLYTGAVLYWCTADSIHMLPGYANAVHCATRESVELAAAYQVRMAHATLFVDGSATQVRAQPETCVRGTCIDAATARRLQTRVEALYMSFIEDVLSGKDAAVRDAMKWLSQRYQRMWGGLLQYLDLLYDAVVHQHTKGHQMQLGKSAAQKLLTLGEQAPTSPEAVAWKMAYLRGRRGLLTAVGILRIEYVESQLRYGSDREGSGASPQAASPNVEANTKAAERAQLVSYAARVLLADLPASVATDLAVPTATLASFLVDLLGPNAKDLQRQMRAAAAPAAAANNRKEVDEEANIAQVILLGLPLRLFSKYFRAHVAAMVRGGVNAMPQPNSVVFSKIGVSKSTALRYLLGKDRVASADEEWQLHVLDTAASGPNATPAARAANFAGCVHAHHGIAMGDNPQSTDYELTVFRDVPFLSVEKESQRVERQRRILRRLQRTQSIESRGGHPQMPDGSPAPSYAELVGSLRRSGPMMDDRLFRNINYIGGEEDGTALFLASLLHYSATEPQDAQGVLTTDAFRDAVRKARCTSRDQLTLGGTAAKL